MSAILVCKLWWKTRSTIENPFHFWRSNQRNRKQFQDRMRNRIYQILNLLKDGTNETKDEKNERIFVPFRVLVIGVVGNSLEWLAESANHISFPESIFKNASHKNQGWHMVSSVLEMMAPGCLVELGWAAPPDIQSFQFSFF